MHSRLPTAQSVFYAFMFALCSAAMSLSAVAHVYVHSTKTGGPPPHVMHFQCVTIAYVTSQQIYFISHFITRLLKPKSAYLTAKVDIGFFLFMMSFGIPTTFINTSKINEFSPPWREGESMPLAWRCVIGDTALLWIISIALVAWVSTEFVVLYNRFGIRDMWHVSLPLLNKEPAHSEDGIADEYSITHKHSDSLDSLRP